MRRVYSDAFHQPCIFSHARLDHRWRFRSRLLCPLPVDRYYFPLLTDEEPSSKNSKTRRDIHVSGQFRQRVTLFFFSAASAIVSQVAFITALVGLEWSMGYRRAWACKCVLVVASALFHKPTPCLERLVVITQHHSLHDLQSHRWEDSSEPIIADPFQ